MDSSHLALAAKLWKCGAPLEAGRIVYENLPPESRPVWASRILKLILGKSEIHSSQLDYLLNVAENKHLWKEGHQAFSEIRRRVLEFDELRRKRPLKHDEELYCDVLSFAELVAKVVYNATNPLDEFDKDSGWYVGASLRGFVELEWPDESFANEAWKLLSSA